MEKNKEEFMKDMERRKRTWGQASEDAEFLIELIDEIKESRHLLSKCKTLIADMVMYNLDKDMYNRYDDVMKQAQKLLTELKEY
tara:strand:- start:3118 stop:3369 length:252 start_codon:yes stop_codon:yes gene_type:complete